MIIPTFLIVVIGSKPRIPIPVLLFLLWPFLLIGALVAGATRLAMPAARWQTTIFARIWVGMCLFCALHGLTVHVNSHDGTNLFIKVV